MPNPVTHPKHIHIALCSTVMGETQTSSLKTSIRNWSTMLKTLLTILDSINNIIMEDNSIWKRIFTLTMKRHL